MNKSFNILRKKIVAISVSYKNSKEQLDTLKKTLSLCGINAENQIFIDNSKDNRGYGGGINKVLTHSLKKYDYFLIINPDTKLEKDCIEKMLSLFEKYPEVGIVGPKILDASRNVWSIGGILDPLRYSGGLIGLGEKNRRHTEDYSSVDFVSGTAMLIKKEVFEKIGFFAEEYFLYYEDVDFCVRARKAGFVCAINPQAEIIHYASSSTGENSPLMQYYMARNHCLIVERFGSLYVKIHEIVRLPKTLWQARNRKYELFGIRDYLLRRFNKRDYWS